MIPDEVIPSLKQAFLSRVDMGAHGHWIWLGPVNSRGYAEGRMAWNGMMMSGHKMSYLLFNGLIPQGKTIDHLCRVRCCVSPLHLEAVTPEENAKRARDWDGEREAGIVVNEGKVVAWNAPVPHVRIY